MHSAIIGQAHKYIVGGEQVGYTTKLKLTEEFTDVDLVGEIYERIQANAHKAIEICKTIFGDKFNMQFGGVSHTLSMAKSVYGSANYEVRSHYPPMSNLYTLIHHLNQESDSDVIITEEAPLDLTDAYYTHDCESCTFLGVVYINGTRGEAYACTESNPKNTDSIIARFSSDGANYCSQPVTCCGGGLADPYLMMCSH